MACMHTCSQSGSGFGQAPCMVGMEASGVARLGVGVVCIVEACSACTGCHMAVESALDVGFLACSGSGMQVIVQVE
jgi:hypothetical protein